MEQNKIRGSLRAVPLSELLEMIHRAGLTGTLVFTIDWVQKKIYFKNGEIISASSTDPREFLGQFLLRKGWITEGQLIEAIETQIKSRRLLGQILLDRGWLTPDQLQQALEEKAYDTIYSLFLAEDATFEFQEEALPTFDLVPISATFEALLLEGAIRRDHWDRIQRFFPALGKTILERAADELPESLRSIESVADTWGALDGRRSLHEIALQLYRTDYSVLDAAAELYDHGLVKIVAVLEDVQEEPLTIPIETLIEACQVKLRDNRLDDAMGLLKAVEQKHAKITSMVLNLQTLVQSKLLQNAQNQISLDKVPRLKIPLDTIMNRKLDPVLAFILSRIDGKMDLRGLKTIVPVPEAEFYRQIRRLIDMELIELVPTSKTRSAP